MTNIIQIEVTGPRVELDCLTKAWVSGTFHNDVIDEEMVLAEIGESWSYRVQGPVCEDRLTCHLEAISPNRFLHSLSKHFTKLVFEIQVTDSKGFEANLVLRDGIVELAAHDDLNIVAPTALEDWEI